MSLMMKLVRHMVKNNTAGMFDQPEIDVAAVRAKLAEMLRKNDKNNKPEKSVDVSFEEVEGIAISLCTPHDWDGRRVLYYVHGGGLITGDHAFAVPYASQLARWTHCQVVSVNYRLAPEHPFPAGLDDSFLIYKRLIQRSEVALIGESGGAYLCFAIALRCKAEGVKLPRSIVVNSIPADFSGKAIERRNLPTETTVTVEGLAALNRLYAPGQDELNPLINVIYGDYAGFPPVRVVYDDGEVLRPDSTAIIDKLLRAGVAVERGQYSGTFHAFTTVGKVVKESRDELNKSAAFIVRHFERAS